MSFAAALARGLGGYARNREDRRRFDEQQAQRDRQLAMQEAFNEQLREIQRRQLALAEQNAVMTAQTQGFRPVADVAARGAQNLEGADAASDPAQRMLLAASGLMQAQRARTPDVQIGGTPMVRSDFSDAERMRREDRQMRREDATREREQRLTDREADRTFQREIAGNQADLQRELTRLQIGARAQPRDQIMAGNDGNLYRITERGAELVPILGGPERDAAPQTLADAMQPPAGGGGFSSMPGDPFGGQRPAQQPSPQPQAAPSRGPFGKPAPSNAAGLRDVMSLRKEFDTKVKTYEIVNDATQQIIALGSIAEPSAQDDMALIFAFVKSQDPTSVVREGEYANAQNAAGVPDQIRNLYNRTISGHRLTPTQRANMLRTAQTIRAASMESYAREVQDYTRLAERYGVDPTDIIGTRIDGGSAAGAAAAGAAAPDPQGRPPISSFRVP